MKMLKGGFILMTICTFVSIIDRNEYFFNVITNSCNKNKIWIFFKRSYDFFTIIQTKDTFINEISPCLYFTGTGSDNARNRYFCIYTCSRHKHGWRQRSSCFSYRIVFSRWHHFHFPRCFVYTIWLISFDGCGTLCIWMLL